MTDRDILLAAHKVLNDPNRSKPWMTARVLAREIRRLDQNFSTLTQIQLFDKLCDHAHPKSDNRLIRNSKLPSARTLEVLWGAIEKVGEREVSSPKLRGDDIFFTETEKYEEEESFENPSLFLSYSFSDSVGARAVVDRLELQGHDVWIAEDRIRASDEINRAVKKAMDCAAAHLLFLSSNSDRSTWVHKETIVAQAAQMRRFVIIDGKDEDIIQKLRLMRNPSTTTGVSSNAKTTKRVAGEFHSLIGRDVWDSDTFIYAHPHVTSSGERFKSIDDFPSPDALLR